MAKPRTVFKLESKYLPFLTDRELEILKNDENCNKHLTYKEDMTMIGSRANAVLDGRTVEEFISELESKLAAFNAKYSCDKDLAVRVDGDRLFIKFAYNEQLKNELKKELGAKWHADSKEWSVSLENETAANEIIKKHLNKGFLKEEAAEVVKEEEEEEVAEEIICTSEELKAKYNNKLFMVDAYTIGLLLGDKFRKFTPCTVDGMEAHLYDFGDIALLHLGAYHGMCLKKFRTTNTDVNWEYEEKAKRIYHDRNLSKEDRAEQIKGLLNNYLDGLRELQ
jgi:hypothetical protein